MNGINQHVSAVVIALLALGGCTFEIMPAEEDSQLTMSGNPPITNLDLDPPDPGMSNQGTTDQGTTGTGIPVWPEPDHEPVIALVAGAAHACALTAEGEVTCWGKNDVGQLGYGHTESVGDDEPLGTHGVVDVGDQVVALSAGRQHTCAILQKGSIRCWGYGGDLALGNGNGKYDTVGDDEQPSDMGDAIIYSNSAFAQLAAGDHHTCMRTEAGSIKCWGDSPQGALGYGYSTKTGGWLGNVPIGDSVSFLAAGADHTCAVVDGGMVRCWGEKTSLGYGGSINIGDNEQPSVYEALWLGEPVTQLAAGDRHTCALTASGAVRCWGQGHYGVLGYGSNQSIHTAEAAGLVNLGGLAVQVAAGQAHNCALMLGGAVRCWGDGSSGALGYGNTEDVGDNEAPAVAGVVDLPEAATQVVAGEEFTCALLASGKVQCWGSGLDGRLGYGHSWNIGDDETPAAIEPLVPFGL